LDLSNKVAVVTGASSGVGAQTAIKLAKLGVSVVINYAKSEQGALKTYNEIISQGGTAVICQADISEEPQCIRIVNKAIESFEQLDIVINNAGTTEFVSHKDLNALTDDIWKKSFATNLMGPFYISRAAVPFLAKQGGGEIVMTSSIAGLTAHGSSIAYCASKAGLNSLTKTLANALGENNIRVNAICPGLIDGEWARSGWQEHWQAAKDYTLSHSAIKRISTSSDIADSIIAILIGSDNMTGQLITLDSGLTL
jgi:3-oxoacyl-[acyl-carrier protein] reductase